eukprot:323385_1
MDQLEIINILNKDTEASTISNKQLIFTHIFDKNRYILSDADEELIILIAFKATVALNSITFHAFPHTKDEYDSSPPKQVHIYKINNLNQSFDDIKSMKPHKSVKCSPSKLENGHTVKLNSKSKHVLTFNNVKYLAIYIESNQRDSEVTNINGIQFNAPTVKKRRSEPPDEQTSVNESTTTENMAQLGALSRLYRCSNAPNDKGSGKKCICGAYLNQIDQMTLAVSDEKKYQYNCDVCRTVIDKKSIFWHCTSNKVHKNGFDVCNKCITSYDPNTCNVTPKQGNDIDSSYLLRPNAIHHDKQPLGCVGATMRDGEYCCADPQCKCLPRLQSILIKYHSWISKNKLVLPLPGISGSKMIDESTLDPAHIFTSNYNEVAMLNDFNHLMNNHRNTFEDISDTFVADCGEQSFCELSNCNILRRNYRERSQSNYRTLYQMYSNCKDVCDINVIQLMDRVHCYYFHSTDTGHRLSNNDAATLMKLQQADTPHDEKQDDPLQPDSVSDKLVINCWKLIETKRHSVRDIGGLDRIVSAPKFSTDMTGDTDVLYNYGVRYFYWDYYKTQEGSIDPIQEGIKELYGIGSWLEKVPANAGFMLKEFYVDANFTNLKEELLRNPICTINLVQWDILVQKAKVHLSTACCREKVCIQPPTIYGILQGTCVALFHVIAIMVYCNFDQLQAKFSMTYRRTSPNEHYLSMIRRHSNYANLGKLLRELVECYPSPNTRVYCWRSLYHGVTIPKPRFMSMDACIKGPVSTTADFAIAINFCDNKGPILEFNLDDHWVKRSETMLCKCWDFSDYPDEREVFFIGGFSNFAFQTIIFPDGSNYREYVFALSAISDQFSVGKSNSSQYLGLNWKQKQMCFRIMSHQMHTHFPSDDKYHEFKGMPTYAKGLAKMHFNNMDFCAVGPEGFIGVIFRSLFCSDNGWVNLDTFTTVFPSVSTIAFLSEANDSMYALIYSSLYHLMQNKPDCCLQKIKIGISLETSDFTTDEYVDHIVEQYEQKYKQISWEIYFEKRRLKKFIIIKSMFKTYENGVRQYCRRDRGNEVKCTEKTKRLFM